MIISVQNQLTTQQSIQQTYVASPISAGGTTSPVKNIAGLQASWAVQFGQTGEETAEILNISGAPSGTALNFGTSPSHAGGTFLFGHAIDAPMYQIHYDQIIFSRSVNGTGGSFSPLATVSITPDSQYTNYNDTSGVASYVYYVQYYNSMNGDTSGSSSIFLPGGPTFYSLQKLRQRVKDKLISAGYIKNDNVIDDWINEWYEIMVNAAIKTNQDFMLGTAVYTFGTAGLGTVTDATFKQAVKFETSWDSGVTYTPSQQIAVHQYSYLDFFNALTPMHAWIGETVFEVLPHSGGGLVKITYAQRQIPLLNDSDEVTQTLKAYTTSCVEYCLSVAYGLDQKDTQQQEHFQKFEALKSDFVVEVTPRDQTGAKTIELVEGIDARNEDLYLSNEWVI